MKKDFSISIAKANIYSIPIVLIEIIILSLPFYLLWGMENLLNISKGINPYLFIALFLTGIVLHEFIHGLGWKIFGKQPWSKIKFGFNAKFLTPFAHCKEPVTAKAYRAGAAAPAIILGFIPVLIGIITGIGSVYFFGLIFTVAACGDFLILWLIRNVDDNAMVEDHPENTGCYVYTSSNDETKTSLQPED